MTMKRKNKSKPLVSKGYSSVRKNAKRLGADKDCNHCIHYLFNQCQNKKVSVYDIVEYYGRTYCDFYEEAK